MAESIKEQIKERTERIWKIAKSKEMMLRGINETQLERVKSLEQTRIALNDIRYLNGIEEMLE